MLANLPYVTAEMIELSSNARRFTALLSRQGAAFCHSVMLLDPLLSFRLRLAIFNNWCSLAGWV